MIAANQSNVFVKLENKEMVNKDAFFKLLIKRTLILVDLSKS